MRRPKKAIQRKKEELRNRAKNRRKEFNDAKDKLKGNPELIEAVEALEGELDAIKESINL